MTLDLSNEDMLALARLFGRSTRGENEQFERQLQNFMMAACRSIFWHDRRPRQPKMRGGSGFVLQFGHRLIGVTAAHVVNAYHDDLAKIPSLVLQFDNVELNLLDALIDKDDELDLATFAVGHHQLRPEAATFDCTIQWPPPEPERGSVVSLIGYPEALRRIRGDMSATFGTYGALAMVEDWTDREIIVIYDRSKEQALAGTKELPPRRFNMSGCSGGPVILHEYRGGLFRWYPVGVINRGPGDDANADIGVDVIRVRRINLLTEEGRINRPTSGWLPT